MERKAWDLEAWQHSREAELRNPWGWLSLIGLVWLEDGVYAVGSQKDAPIHLPRLPGPAGLIRVEGSQVRYEPGLGVRDFTVDAAPGKGAVILSSDKSGPSTVLRLGDYELTVIWRSGRLALRLKDSKSPTLLKFPGPRRFPVNPELRIEGRWTAFDKTLERQEPTAQNREEPETYHGEVAFNFRGNSWKLLAQVRGEQLVIRFRDRTTGSSTYGAFRFISAPLPGPDGLVDLDFNRSYNPPCAYTPWATCSLPPPENRLNFAVEAGELTP